MYRTYYAFGGFKYPRTNALVVPYVKANVSEDTHKKLKHRAVDNGTRIEDEAADALESAFAEDTTEITDAEAIDELGGGASMEGFGDSNE